MAARVRLPLVVLVSALIGCSSGPAVLCPCPAGGAEVSLNGLPAAVATVSTDSPCSAANTGNAVLVTSPRAGTCRIHLRLTNGDAYTSSVSFKAAGGCCPYTYFGTSSSLERTDAGTD